MKKLITLFFIAYLPLQLFAQVDADSIMNMTLEELMNVPLEIGTRGSERNSFESLVPIDVITKEEIEISGLTDLVDVLQRYIPSVFAPRTSITDGSDHVRAFSLRGMGADQMLVLINGVRKPGTSLVHVNTNILRGTTSNDLNMIPVSAIERIEILRDGAAAQYGSDAISGIINIVLKKEVTNNTSVSYMQTTEGDGQTYNVRGAYGFNLSENDYLMVATDLRQRGATNRSIPRTDLSGADAHLNDKQLYRLGDANLEDYGFAYNFSHNIANSDETKLYSFGYYNKRYGESGGYYRLPSQSRVPLYGFPDGFLPLLKPVISESFLTNGFETVVNDWKLNLSSTLSSNSMQFNLENSLNSSLGPYSQTHFYCGTLTFKQNIFNLNAYKSFDIGLDEPLNIGFGSELRTETFIQNKGEEASYIQGDYKDSVLLPDNSKIVRNSYPAGSQMFPGFRPENERNKSRNNAAFYLDIENKPLSILTLNLAARYEYFTDFGQTLNGKFAFRLEPMENIALRASASTGFRAPSIGQSYFTAIQTNLVSGQLIQSGTYSVEDKIAIELGATPLKPEKSVNGSVGFVFNAVENLSISFDYFYIDITDRIVLTGSFASSSASDYVKNVLTNYNVEGVKYFTNAVNTNTSGLDAVLRYNLDLNSFGSLLFTASANYNQTKIVGDVKVPEVLQNDKEVFFDRQQRVKIEKGQPQLNTYLTVTHKTKKTSVEIRAIKYGEVTYVESAANPDLDQVFASKYIFDASVKFQVMKNVSFQVGAHNILNSYPDKFAENRSDYFLVYYTEASPFGVNGTDIYFNIRYNF